MSPDHSRPGIEIDFADPAPLWRDRLSDVEEICATAARAALAAAERREAELAIVLTDDAAVRLLNRDWRGQDKSTNVLSFPTTRPSSCTASRGAPVLLGDVVLAFETVAREAAEQGKSLADHLRHLVVHGVLHLLGHDHEAEEEAERMERLETEVLARLGVADPYRADAHG
jgi:probable rRNA maturation factor